MSDSLPVIDVEANEVVDELAPAQPSPDVAPTSGAASIPVHVHAALEVIRSAFLPSSDEAARHLAREACYRLLQLLGAPTPPPTPATAHLTAVAPAVQAIAELIRKTPPDQLLDLAIERLRRAVPPGAQVPVTPPLRFQFVPVAVGNAP